MTMKIAVLGVSEKSGMRGTDLYSQLFQRQEGHKFEASLGYLASQKLM